MRQPNEGFNKSLEKIKKKDSEIKNKLNTSDENVNAINRKSLKHN
ncbi:hypothetical protein [Bacillus cereus]|nr:hypothetical protein [Bacillus cereus]